MGRTANQNNLPIFDPIYEKEYVIRIARDDGDAFRALYTYYSPRIYSKLLKVLKSGDLAADLLQDIFSIIWQKRHQIDPDKSFGAFLFKIADNLVIDLFRKAKRDQKLLQSLLAASTENWENAEQQLLKKENETWLLKAIGNLPPQQQLVFRLCKLDNKSHEEVSQLLGISKATVNNHLVKALQHLKHMASVNPDLARLLLVLWLFS